MRVSKKNTLIVSIFTLVIAAIAISLYFYPITELKKLDSKQVSSVVYMVEEDRVLYTYSEDASEKLITLLKNAKLQGFPTNQSGKFVGGGLFMPVTIIFEDNSMVKVSCLTADKFYLIINRKWYLCDKQTVENFKNIDRECYSEFRELKGLD